MPLVRRFAFLTTGCQENGGAHNCGAVARSSFGSVCMTCGAWPPCHKLGTLVHVGGDSARDASRTRVGRSTFKNGSISRVVAMPRSPCIHHALPPFGPLDGVRRCSLGDPRQDRRLQRSHRRRARARGGATDLVFFLLLLVECNPVGVGILPPSLSFKDFHHAARSQPPVGGHPQG
jgi:hypothetical protein